MKMMFVGDFHKGNLYHFDLGKDRKELSLSGQLADKIANTTDTIANTTNELQDIICGQGFDGITDIEVGPDGYLYVVSIHLKVIYRIVPYNTNPLQ